MPSGGCAPAKDVKCAGVPGRFYCSKTLTRGIRLKLEDGAATLKPGEWSAITDSVYAKYTTMMKSDRPSKAEYQQIVGEILDEHPGLRGNLSLPDAMDLIKRHVRDKFRNKRASHKRELSPDSRANSVVPAKRRRVVGLPNYAPAPPAEGEVVMQRKINELRHAETAGAIDSCSSSRINCSS